MALSWYKGKTPIQKELDATAAESYVLGEALVLSSGKATKCGATTKPEFICANKDFTAASGDKVVVQVIEEDMEFKTTFSATATSIVPGNKVTLHTDGAQVTATTSSGVAEVVDMRGTASGSEVIVKF